MIIVSFMKRLKGFPKSLGSDYEDIINTLYKGQYFLNFYLIVWLHVNMDKFNHNRSIYSAYTGQFSH